jgi:hypothetical protein
MAACWALLSGETRTSSDDSQLVERSPLGKVGALALKSAVSYSIVGPLPEGSRGLFGGTSKLEWKFFPFHGQMSAWVYFRNPVNPKILKIMVHAEMNDNPNSSSFQPELPSGITNKRSITSLKD